MAETHNAIVLVSITYAIGPTVDSSIWAQLNETKWKCTARMRMPEKIRPNHWINIVHRLFCVDL